MDDKEHAGRVLAQEAQKVIADLEWLIRNKPQFWCSVGAEAKLSGLQRAIKDVSNG